MANETEYGSFVPTTQIWDTGQFMEVDVKSKEFKELLLRLYQNVNLIATVLNSKDTGIYDTSIFVNGQTFFPNPVPTSTPSLSSNFRAVYRRVMDMGALLDTDDNHKAHGIICDGNTTFTRIYGAASKVTAPYNYIPLPYVDTLGNNVQLYVDGTEVHVVTMDDKTAYTQCYVVVEYLVY